ncbi:MerR family transcriptional regulator [Pseudomonas sichuanensis]|uniref:MerR family transcriptional regulator n=1 Tax=Pseudomonas sichuanensis TaxID=2213015 RepID=UPI003806CD31
MKIGELAKRSGLAASRIRFYEASGLIKAVERRANGYRDYGPEAVWILEIITGAQRAGFSLEEIRHLLPVGPNAWRKDGLLDGLKRKVTEIEAMQQRLAQSRAQLLIAIDSIENGPEGMPCDDNTQRVLERLREGSAEGVKAHRGVE